MKSQQPLSFQTTLRPEAKREQWRILFGKSDFCLFLKATLFSACASKESVQAHFPSLKYWYGVNGFCAWLKEWEQWHYQLDKQTRLCRPAWFPFQLLHFIQNWGGVWRDPRKQWVFSGSEPLPVWLAFFSPGQPLHPAGCNCEPIKWNPSTAKLASCTHTGNPVPVPYSFKRDWSQPVGRTLWYCMGNPAQSSG